MRAFVYHAADGTQRWFNAKPLADAEAHFGEALAMSYSGQVAVGAGGADGGAGRVYLFTSIAAGEEHTLLDDLDFDDPALKACVESQAALNGWATIAELTSLNCAGAGLAGLTGLEDLDSLDSLDLSDNPGLLCSELDTLEAALPNTTLTRPEPCSTDAGSGATPQAVQYLYNAQGQRVARTLDNDPATTVHYLYDQAGLLLAEIEASTGAKLREYIYLNGQPVAVVDDTGTTEEAIYYVHNDHLGTPQKLTDTNQQVVWAADYEPFGKANVTVAAVEYNQRFPGQYEDSETGLHYNYFRDYDPGTGRYVESDPVGLGGGLNTFIYALSNPAIYIDPTGLNVYFVCRPLGEFNDPNFLGNRGGKHCAVFIEEAENACSVGDRQYSLGGEERSFYPQNTSGNDTFNTDRRTFQRYKGILVRKPNSGSQRNFEDTIRRTAENYRQGPYEAYPGPNSNTAADNLIELSGGKVPTIPGAVGQNYGE